MVYGSPSAGFLKQLARTKSVWGGCVVDGTESAWFCLTCGREWGRIQEDTTYYCEQCGRPSSSAWCEDCVERAHEEAAKVFEELNRELDRRERLATVRAEAFVALLTLALQAARGHSDPLLDEGRETSRRSWLRSEPEPYSP